MSVGRLLSVWALSSLPFNWSLSYLFHPSFPLPRPLTVQRSSDHSTMGAWTIFLTKKFYFESVLYICLDNVFMLGNSQNIHYIFHAISWIDYFPGYCLCGSTKRWGKANPVWISQAHTAPFHQGWLRSWVKRFRRELVPCRSHTLRVLLPRHGRTRRSYWYCRKNCWNRYFD